MKHIYDREDWPAFRWNEDAIRDDLAAVRHRQGLLQGRMLAIGFSAKESAVLQNLTDDVVKSSEIEGEFLNPDDVRSSIATRLGIDIGAIRPSDRAIDGVVEMMLDATQNYEKPLTAERLWGWQAALFPTGRSGFFQVRTGGWRDGSEGPMQVVSGGMGVEKVHFQAPEADALDRETEAFINWFESEAMDLVLKAAIAHLWFVTVHPLEDGNGRVARAITDLTLARSEGSPMRFYSMSSQIQEERKDYYNILETTQKGTLDISGWLVWFIGCLHRSIVRAETTLDEVFKRARFWEIHSETPFNERQRKVLNRFLTGFEGKLTTSKWAALAKCSPDTALRDIEVLIALGVLEKNPEGGRSTSYRLSARFD